MRCVVELGASGRGSRSACWRDFSSSARQFSPTPRRLSPISPIFLPLSETFTSLREDMAPLDMVLPDQFIDLTKQRASTFFGNGAVAHVSMAEPVCSLVADALARAVQKVGATDPVRLHREGTYVCIEGPQFSSMAESNWYRSMGASVIGMTNMPEAKLAKEAQIAYATLAMVTDYDCWHPKEAHVSADLAIANLMKNAARAQEVAVEAVRILGRERPLSPAHSALASALVTQRDAMPEGALKRLHALL